MVIAESVAATDIPPVITLVPTTVGRPTEVKMVVKIGVNKGSAFAAVGNNGVIASAMAMDRFKVFSKRSHAGLLRLQFRFQSGQPTNYQGGSQERGQLYQNCCFEAI